MTTIPSPSPFDARFAEKAKIIFTIHNIHECTDYIACYGWYLNNYLYIGKSNTVRTRILSHLPLMIRRLGSLAIRDMEFHVWECEDEFTLGIVEGKLICKYRPKYNRNGLNPVTSTISYMETKMEPKYETLFDKVVKDYFSSHKIHC